MRKASAGARLARWRMRNVQMLAIAYRPTAWFTMARALPRHEAPRDYAIMHTIGRAVVKASVRTAQNAVHHYT